MKIVDNFSSTAIKLKISGDQLQYRNENDDEYTTFAQIVIVDDLKIALKLVSGCRYDMLKEEQFIKILNNPLRVVVAEKPKE